MEVHPPEHAIRSWRDFFVHMATIVLGLLIAIGLEQSVEWLHHRHELQELRKGLRQDAEKNMRDTEDMHASLDAESQWISGRIRQVAVSLSSHTPVNAPVERTRTPPWDAPIGPTWSAAKSSGLLAIVPAEEVKAYSEIDGIISAIPEYSRNAETAFQKRVSFETSFSGPDSQQVPDFSSASPADLRQYLTLLQDELYSVTRYLSLVRWIHGAEAAFLRGETSLDRIQAAEHEAWIKQ